MTESRILFLHANDASFVRADRRILEGAYDVRELDCSRGSSLLTIFQRMSGVDLSYSWFALGHAARAVALGKLLRRPSIVVAGGWDVVSIPEISYGATRSRRGLARSRFVLRHSDGLLTFSESSRAAIRLLSNRDSRVISLGVDHAAFRPRGRKEDLVVSVGNVTRENLARKGMETFVRAAGFALDVPFVLAGAHVDDAIDYLRAIATPNVSFPGRLLDGALQDLFARAKVYAQLSYSEGFGLAVAEAMSAGCVPVVTKRGSLPELVAETGTYAPLGDPRATADAIRTALASGRGGEARERVKKHYSFEQRKARLLEFVGGLMEGKLAS